MHALFHQLRFACSNDDCRDVLTDIYANCDFDIIDIGKLQKSGRGKVGGVGEGEEGRKGSGGGEEGRGRVK